MSPYVPLCLLCGGLTAFMARTKSRSPLAWFFIGLFTGPLGVIALLALGDG